MGCGPNAQESSKGSGAIRVILVTPECSVCQFAGGFYFQGPGAQQPIPQTSPIRFQVAAPLRRIRSGALSRERGILNRVRI